MLVWSLLEKSRKLTDTYHASNHELPSKSHARTEEQMAVVTCNARGGRGSVIPQHPLGRAPKLYNATNPVRICISAAKK